jgi:hypothetical protein
MSWSSLVYVPFPLVVITCGPLIELSFIVTEPVRMPFAVGVNVTLIVQVDPTDNEDPQLFVCA